MTVGMAIAKLKSKFHGKHVPVDSPEKPGSGALIESSILIAKKRSNNHVANSCTYYCLVILITLLANFSTNSHFSEDDKIIRTINVRIPSVYDNSREC